MIFLNHLKASESIPTEIIIDIIICFEQYCFDGLLIDEKNILDYESRPRSSRKPCDDLITYLKTQYTTRIQQLAKTSLFFCEVLIRRTNARRTQIRQTYERPQDKITKTQAMGCFLANCPVRLAEGHSVSFLTQSIYLKDVSLLIDEVLKALYMQLSVFKTLAKTRRQLKQIVD